MHFLRAVTHAIFFMFAIVTTTACAADPFVVGKITDPAIPESSGLIESRVHPGTFYTHNDSGNPPNVFAIDARGKTLYTIPVDATNRDWEDIAIDEQNHLYIAEIGNNSGNEKQAFVYEIDEPPPPANGEKIAPVKVIGAWTLDYPHKPFDAESLFLSKGFGYVISKRRDLGHAALYRFDLAKPKQTLAKVCDLPIRVPVTAADLSQDGKSLAVMTVAGPFLFENVDVNDFAKLAHASPRSITLVELKNEAICFTAGGLMGSSEDREVYFFPFDAFGGKSATTHATTRATSQ